MSVKSYIPAKCLSKSIGNIATAPDGTLWYTSNRPVLTQLDQRGRVLAELPIKGFKSCAIAIDANYTFWLADQFRFARFTQSGKQELVSGGKGIRKGQFNTITSIHTLADNSIVIADMYTHRVQHFDRNGRFLNQWGGYGIRGEGKFNYIGGMTVTENNHIYTVENAIPNKCERVQHFDNNRHFVQQWGKEGTGNGEFTSPCGIFNDRRGSLFVCDSYRLQQFDYNGKHIQNIPYPKMNKWNWAHGGAVAENGTLFVCHSQLGLWIYKTAYGLFHTEKRNLTRNTRGTGHMAGWSQKTERFSFAIASLASGCKRRRRGCFTPKSEIPLEIQVELVTRRGGCRIVACTSIKCKDKRQPQH